jgi:hypothetical protein
VPSAASLLQTPVVGACAITCRRQFLVHAVAVLRIELGQVRVGTTTRPIADGYQRDDAQNQPFADPVSVQQCQCDRDEADCQGERRQL